MIKTSSLLNMASTTLIFSQFVNRKEFWTLMEPKSFCHSNIIELGIRHRPDLAFIRSSGILLELKFSIRGHETLLADYLLNNITPSNDSRNE